MIVPSDPGVTVAQGDPGRLSAAAGQHTALADGLDSHASRIEAGVISLEPVWYGQAASAFRALDALRRGLPLRRRRLAQAQTDERTARTQLEHALDQLRHWQQPPDPPAVVSRAG